MSSTKITANLKPVWKIVSYVGLAFLGGVSLYMTWLILSGNAATDKYYLASIFVFILIGSVISTFYLAKTKLVIHEDGITNQGLFSTFTIPYENIEKIKFDSMCIYLIGAAHSVSIGNLSTNFEEASAFITEQIIERDNISFEVKEKYLNKLDSNPLYKFWVED